MDGMEMKGTDYDKASKGLFYAFLVHFFADYHVLLCLECFVSLSLALVIFCFLVFCFFFPLAMFLLIQIPLMQFTLAVLAKANWYINFRLTVLGVVMSSLGVYFMHCSYLQVPCVGGIYAFCFELNGLFFKAFIPLCFPAPSLFYQLAVRSELFDLFSYL